MSKISAMTPVVPAFLILSSALFSVTVAQDCEGYTSSSGMYQPPITCNTYPWDFSFCCGTCDHRYCCNTAQQMFTKIKQRECSSGNWKRSNVSKFVHFETAAIGLSVAAGVILIALFITCCVCPCCCIYKMCQKPRPVTQAVTVTTQYAAQQPVRQGGQYPQYQPVPTQPGYAGHPAYGGQPMPTGPYQGQPFAPGPPPSYQEAASPAYPAPYSQAANDLGQVMYPMQPPVQPGYTYPPPPTDYTSTQPPYNPAYINPPKTGY